VATDGKGDKAETRWLAAPVHRAAEHVQNLQLRQFRIPACVSSRNGGGPDGFLSRYPISRSASSVRRAASAARMSGRTSEGIRNRSRPWAIDDAVPVIAYLLLHSSIEVDHHHQDGQKDCSPTIPVRIVSVIAARSSMSRQR
jgi:hypothetical protein